MLIKQSKNRIYISSVESSPHTVDYVISSAKFDKSPISNNQHIKQFKLTKFFANLSGLSEDDLTSVSNETIYSSVELLDYTRRFFLTSSQILNEPLINVDYYDSLMFEFWSKQKSLTFYINYKSVDYLKAWGTDIENQMEDGHLNIDDKENIKHLLCWLGS